MITDKKLSNMKVIYNAKGYLVVGLFMVISGMAMAQDNAKVASEARREKVRQQLQYNPTKTTDNAHAKVPGIKQNTVGGVTKDSHVTDYKAMKKQVEHYRKTYIERDTKELDSEI